MCKKCTKCGEVKCLADFSKDKCRSDGLFPWCRNCKRASRRTSKVSCVCKKCGSVFENSKSRKNCFSCRPKNEKLSVENPFKTCKCCMKSLKKCKFHKNTTSLDGATNYCKSCVRYKQSQMHKLINCSKCDVKFSAPLGRGRNKTCYQCLPKRLFHDKQHCLSVSLNFSHRHALEKGNNSVYNKIIRENWQDPCFNHMYPPCKAGFGRGNFVTNCRNSGNAAILYLIKCTGNDESFYKYGITSTGSVHNRYPTKSKMPYDFEIIWQLSGDPGEMWDLEQFSHSQTKKYRYQPGLWGRKALETFKCHGNCKILRKP